MADSKKQRITAIGKDIKIDASITHVHNDNLSVPEGYMLVEKEEHNKRLEEHKERLEDKLRKTHITTKKCNFMNRLMDLKTALPTCQNP